MANSEILLSGCVMHLNRQMPKLTESIIKCFFSVSLKIMLVFFFFKKKEKTILFDRRITWCFCKKDRIFFSSVNTGGSCAFPHLSGITGNWNWLGMQQLSCHFVAFIWKCTTQECWISPPAVQPGMSWSWVIAASEWGAVQWHRRNIISVGTSGCVQNRLGC